MKHHPYTEIWPLMSGDDFEKLKADIKAHGLRMDLITYQGKLLDGRNRERACEAVGVPVRYADAGVATDADALAMVVSLNDHRRHLSLEQRVFAGERLANIINGHNRFIEKIIGISTETPIITNDHHALPMKAAAKAMNVSVGSVKRARAVVTYGDQRDVDDVISGKVSLTAKCNQVRPKFVPKNKPPKRAIPGRPPKDESRSQSPAASTNNGPGPKHLTPKEVDPEFCGTALEFAAKYGHVNQHTAEEYATMRFDDLASDMKALAKRCREFPERKTVDSDWLRNPNPRSVAQLTEALDYLRPKIAEAEALLERAVVALKKEK